ncbi:MAG TPA: TetR/AcrR family transcriptional regulator [Bryobacteraceae bacterium]|nr:TetR/AcrR family transcriptional regulator [Bryobacteraceae bacterium]
MNHSTLPATRMSAPDRKQQLLETALDLFSRKGFEGTTTKELASAAGVAEAVIFRHFPSKQALYTAALDYKVQSGEALNWMTDVRAFMEQNDDEGLFRTIASRVLRSYRTDPRFERMVLFAALEGHEVALAYMRQQSFPLFQLLDEYVQRRQVQGALEGLRPMFILSAIFGMAHHYAQVSEMFGFIPEPPPDEEVVHAFVQILMNGIRPPDSRIQK